MSVQATMTTPAPPGCAAPQFSNQHNFQYCQHGLHDHHLPQPLSQARPAFPHFGLEPDIHWRRSKHPGHPSNINIWVQLWEGRRSESWWCSTHQHSPWIIRMVLIIMIINIIFTWREAAGSGRAMTHPRVSVELHPSPQLWAVVVVVGIVVVVVVVVVVVGLVQVLPLHWHNAWWFWMFQLSKFTKFLHSPPEYRDYRDWWQHRGCPPMTRSWTKF